MSGGSEEALPAREVFHRKAIPMSGGSEEAPTAHRIIRSEP
jgi:hypothetical protein